MATFTAVLQFEFDGTHLRILLNLVCSTVLFFFLKNPVKTENQVLPFGYFNIRNHFFLKKRGQTHGKYGAKPQKSNAQLHEGRAVLQQVQLREGRAVSQFTVTAKYR